jgi:hypothetical protein
LLLCPGALSLKNFATLQADLFWPKGRQFYCILENVLTPKDEVELGIYDARVPYGAHIAFFWRTRMSLKIAWVSWKPD